MKIENNGNPLGPVSAKPSSQRPAVRNDAPPTAPASAPETARSSATVNINPLASQLQSLEGRLAQEPAVDAQRVAEIRQAIREGRFSINPEAIADKLVASVKELLADN